MILAASILSAVLLWCLGLDIQEDIRLGLEHRCLIDWPDICI
jgi:hypothetical protein